MKKKNQIQQSPAFEELAQKLSSYLPEGVSCVVDQISQHFWNHIFSEEQNLLKKALPKRLNAFATGRYCAQLAMEKLGVAPFPLLKDNAGAPLWPKGIIGSITHNDALAVAAVGAYDQVKSVGIDIESLGRIKQSFWRLIFSEPEQQFLRANPELENQIATAYFTAKEAVYKMIYQMTQDKVNFTDIYIRLSDNLETFVVEFLSDDLRERYMILSAQGKLMIEKEWVFAASWA